MMVYVRKIADRFWLVSWQEQACVRTRGAETWPDAMTLANGIAARAQS